MNLRLHQTASRVSPFKVKAERRVVRLKIRPTFSCFGPFVSFVFVQLIPLVLKPFHFLCSTGFKIHFLQEVSWNFSSLCISSALVNSTRSTWFGCTLCSYAPAISLGLATVCPSSPAQSQDGQVLIPRTCESLLIRQKELCRCDYIKNLESTCLFLPPASWMLTAQGKTEGLNSVWLQNRESLCPRMTM